MAKVTLKGIEKVYPNGFKAVHGHHLEIQDGEFMVFVGPSGCAKSTTLRMIAGLEEITGGEIWIGDKMVNELPPKDRDIAMVFQNYALYPHMDVFDNMAFGLKLKKVAKEEIEKRVKDAAEILGITDLLYRKPKEMSGGQRQRVAVGRAIVRNPSVFLFDEPLSNLDAKLRVHMRVEITKLHKKLKTTMIYVTHDQVEAMTMGDRICVMELGKIKQVDTPINLYNRPQNKFVAGFIGSPAMNMVTAKITKSEDSYFAVIEDGKIALRLPAEKAEKVKDYVGRELWFGIRPENIQSHSKHLEDKENFVRAEVYVVEQMGNEVFVYFAMGTHQFIARLGSDVNVKSGQNHELWFDMKECHFFDKETEENISI
jgi:multiple sugar transport system ATP-binding protein